MKIPLLKPSLLAAGIALAAGAQAADVRINGFASLAGGKTLSEATTRDHVGISPTFGQTGKSVYVADPVTEGVYDDDWSFKPDSVYGLQITADLGEGLSLTGQVTGHGGEDFDAVVSWAYVNYEFNENWSVMGGRQRLPLFYYSDFIDVGYAYHWIRPPQELVASDGDTFEGVKVRWSTITGNWDWTVDAYYGSGEEDVDGIDIESKDQHGVVLKASNSWLTLRGTWSKSDTVINDQLATVTGQGTKEDPLEYTFWGLATHMNFGNVFVVSEYTHGEPNEPAFSTVVLPGPVIAADVNGKEESTGWYISSGIRLGDFTPHLTYSRSKDDYQGTTTKFEGGSEAWTAGVRWDFHSNAALKLEYTTRTDKSDDYFRNQAGGIVGLQPGVGWGKPEEVDVLSFAIDVIF